MRLKDFFSIFVENTPLYMTLVISLFVSVLVVYFFIPKSPKVVYSFDAEKFKKDLVLRASIAGGDPIVVSKIAQELRKELDNIAFKDKTVVINRRAVLSNALPNIEIVDITKNMEQKFFDKYLPLTANAFKELLNKDSSNGTN